MTRDKNHLPRFLSVAHQMGLLTPRQIEQILYDQRRLKEAGINEKVGQVAEHLGYLSPQDAEKVEGERSELRHAGKQMDDETGWRYRVVRSLSPKTKGRLSLLGAIIAFAALVIAFLMTRSWETVGIAASILSLAWIIVPKLILGVHLTVSGWLRWLGSPLAILIGISLYTALPKSLILPWWWYSGLCFLPLMVLLESSASFWRNFKLSTSELRSCLIRCLAKSFRDNYMAMASGRQEVDKAIDELMLWTARTIYLNPWNRLLRYFVPGRMAHPGVTTLWFLRPDSSSTSIEFTASNHVAIGPPRVCAVFDKFREHYRPRIDFTELSHAQNKLMEEGLIPEAEFLKESLVALKSDYVSLAGLVFHKERGLDGDDVSQFWGFERTHYQKLIEQAAGDDQALLKDSLWRAFAAYPVYSGGPQHGKPPAGVLVAFSNTRNGIINRDRNVLVSSARLIGVLLGKNQAAMDLSEVQHANQGEDNGAGRAA